MKALLNFIKNLADTSIYTDKSHENARKEIACLIEKLRCSQKKLRMYKEFWDNSNEAFILVKSEKGPDQGTILDVNRAACSMYGYTMEEFLTLNFEAITDEPECTRVSVSEKLINVPLRWHLKKGKIRFPVSATLTHFNDQGYDVAAIILRERVFRGDDRNGQSIDRRSNAKNAAQDQAIRETA